MRILGDKTRGWEKTPERLEKETHTRGARGSEGTVCYLDCKGPVVDERSLTCVEETFGGVVDKVRSFRRGSKKTVSSMARRTSSGN